MGDIGLYATILCSIVAVLFVVDKHLTLYFSNRSEIQDLAKNVMISLEDFTDQLGLCNQTLTKQQHQISELNSEVSALSVKEGFS